MDDNTQTQTYVAISQRLTLLILATPITIEGLPMGDAFVFRNHLEAERYLATKPLLRDRDIFDTLLIPCRYGRG